MERFAGGDSAAFGVLYDRYERRVLAYVRRRVTTREIAEERAQDVFERVVRSRDQYIAGRSFRAWLFSIARNLCIDEARRRSHRRESSLDAPVSDESATDFKSMLADLCAPAGPVEAERNAFLRALEAAMTKLPEEQREAFELRFGEGLKFREIGDLQGVSENTVKSRLRYALQLLSGELSDYRGVSFDHEAAAIVARTDQRGQV